MMIVEENQERQRQINDEGKMSSHRAVVEYLCLYSFSNDEFMVITSFLLSFLSITTTL